MKLLCRRGLLGFVFAGLLGVVSNNAAHANIFVTDHTNGTVGDYTDAGVLVNASLISIQQPTGIAVSGSNLLRASPPAPSANTPLRALR